MRPLRIFKAFVGGAGRARALLSFRGGNNRGSARARLHHEQRLQRRTTAAGPTRQRRTRRVHTRARVDGPPNAPYVSVPEFNGFLVQTKAVIRPRKKLKAEPARELMFSYFSANKDALPAWIRDHRDYIIELIMEGFPAEQANQEAVALGPQPTGA